MFLNKLMATLRYEDLLILSFVFADYSFDKEMVHLANMRSGAGRRPKY